MAAAAAASSQGSPRRGRKHGQGSDDDDDDEAGRVILEGLGGDDARALKRGRLRVLRLGQDVAVPPLGHYH